jgi:His-Xaa-Ser system protein HxsD
MEDNLKVYDNFVVVEVNPELFSLDAIYLAGYQLTDKAYIIFDGDPDDVILVKIIPKDKKDLKNIGWEFSNELLSSQVYDIMSKKNSKIKEEIIQKAMETVSDDIEPNEEKEGFQNERH